MAEKEEAIEPVSEEIQDPSVAAAIAAIRENAARKIAEANRLLVYLSEAQASAAAEEEAEEEALKRRGIIVGQHIPSLPSKLVLSSAAVAEEFGDELGDGLFVARELVAQNQENFLRRTGNLPLSTVVEARTQSLAASGGVAGLAEEVPNYLAATNATRVREERNAVRFADTLENTKQFTATTREKRVTAAQKLARQSGQLAATNRIQNVSNSDTRAEISAKERLQHEAVLRGIRHRLGYLRNPRNNPNAVSKMLVRTAAVVEASAISNDDMSSDETLLSGGGKSNNEGSSAAVMLKAKYANAQRIRTNPLFVCEPDSVLYSDYDVGKKYTTTLIFRNVSAVSRTVRIVPPKQKTLFQLSPLKYPSGSSGSTGLIAPGMSVTAVLSFTPSALGDFVDSVRIQTEAGDLDVPVRASREPPQLSLPPVIQLGSSFIGDAQRVAFSVVNTGGYGKFLIRELSPPSGLGGSGNFDESEAKPSLRLPPFTVYPTLFELSKGASSEVVFEFVPRNLGISTRRFEVICDSGARWEYMVSASAVSLAMAAVELNGVSHSPTAKPPILPPPPIDNLGRAIPLTEFYDALKHQSEANLQNKPMTPPDGSADIGELLSVYSDVNFMDVPLGGESSSTIVVANDSGLPVEYEWVWLPADLPRSEWDRAGAELVYARQEKAAETVFGDKTENENLNSNSIDNNVLDSSLLRSLRASLEEQSTDTNSPQRGRDIGGDGVESLGFHVTPARGILAGSGAHRFQFTFSASPTIHPPTPASPPFQQRAVLMAKSLPRASVPGPWQAISLEQLQQNGHGAYARLESWLEEVGVSAPVQRYERPNGSHSTMRHLVSLETITKMLVSYVVRSSSPEDSSDENGDRDLDNVTNTARDLLLAIKNTVDERIAQLSPEEQTSEKKIQLIKEEVRESYASAEELEAAELEVSTIQALARVSRWIKRLIRHVYDDRRRTKEDYVADGASHGGSVGSFETVTSAARTAAISAVGGVSISLYDWNSDSTNDPRILPVCDLFPQGVTPPPGCKTIDEDEDSDDDASEKDTSLGTVNNEDLEASLANFSSFENEMMPFVWVTAQMATSLLGPLLSSSLDRLVAHEAVDAIKDASLCHCTALGILFTATVAPIPLRVTPPLFHCGENLPLNNKQLCKWKIHNSSEAPLQLEMKLKDAKVYRYYPEANATKYRSVNRGKGNSFNSEMLGSSIEHEIRESSNTSIGGSITGGTPGGGSWVSAPDVFTALKQVAAAFSDNPPKKVDPSSEVLVECESCGSDGRLFLLPHASETVRLLVSASAVGRYRVVIPVCALHDSDSLSNGMGSILAESLIMEFSTTGPKVRIVGAEVDFGLLPVGGESSSRIVLINDGLSDAVIRIRPTLAGDKPPVDNGRDDTTIHRTSSQRSIGGSSDDGGNLSRNGSFSRHGSFNTSDGNTGQLTSRSSSLSRQSSIRSDDFSVADSAATSVTGGDFKIEAKTAVVTAEVDIILLRPGESRSIQLSIKAGKTAQRLRGIIEARVFAPTPTLLAAVAATSAVNEETEEKISTEDHAANYVAEFSTNEENRFFVQEEKLLSRLYTSLRGEIQSPRVILSPMGINLGAIFVGRPVAFTLCLENVTSLPARFKFVRPGGSSTLWSWTLTPSRGVLGPKERLIIVGTVTALSSGSIDDVLACKLFGATAPLGVGIRATARGVSLEYFPWTADLEDEKKWNEIPIRPLAPPEAVQLPSAELPPAPRPPGDVLDLSGASGSVELYSRRSCRVVLRNLSAISTAWRIAPTKYAVRVPLKRGSPAALAETAARIANPVEADYASAVSGAIQVGKAPGSAANESHPITVVDDDDDSDEDDNADGEKKDKTLTKNRILTPNEEGTARFTSQAGKVYIAAALDRRADKAFLKTGLGAAFHCDAPAGILPPWGVCIVTLTALNDSPGVFTDDLRLRYCEATSDALETAKSELENCSKSQNHPAEYGAAVAMAVLRAGGEEKEVRLPVRLSVAGCPVVVEPATTGLRNVAFDDTIEAAARRIQNNRKQLTDNGTIISAAAEGFPNSAVGEPLLSLGEGLEFGAPLRREFALRNNGSAPAQVKWIIQTLPGAARGPIRTGLAVVSAGNDSTLALHANVGFWEDQSSDCPFHITPPSATVPPYGVIRFVVELSRNAVGTVRGYLKAILHFDSTPTPSASKDSSDATEFSVSLYAMGEFKKPQLLMDGTTIAVDTLDTLLPDTDGLSLSAQATQIFASPPQNVEKNSSAAVASRLVNISNPLVTELQATVWTEGPFIVRALADAASSSAARLKAAVLASGSHVVASSDDAASIGSVSADSLAPTVIPKMYRGTELTLSPNASVKLLVLFQPRRADRERLSERLSTTSASTDEPVTMPGQLVFAFPTGQRLRLPLVTTIAAPLLMGSSPRLYFGVVHPTAGLGSSAPSMALTRGRPTPSTNKLTATLNGSMNAGMEDSSTGGGVATTFLLSNPTSVPAIWTVSHVLDGGQWKAPTTVRVAGFDRIAEVDDPSVWNITPSSGTVEGPTLSVAAAMAAPPRDWLRDLGDGIVPQRLVHTTWATATLTPADTLAAKHATGAAITGLGNTVLNGSTISFLNTSPGHVTTSTTSPTSGGSPPGTGVPTHFPQPVRIEFRPRDAVRYSSRFRFTCAWANSFDLVLQGQGTFEEHEHRPLQPLPPV